MIRQNLRKLADKSFNLPLIFAVIALCFGLYFIVKVPPLMGIDGPVHFARAYQFSEGHLHIQKVPNVGYGGQLPANLVGLSNYVYGDLADNTDGSSILHRKDVDNIGAYKVITKQKFSKDTKFFAFPGGASYTPVAYAPAILGIWVSRTANLSIGATIFTARLFSLLTYVLVVAWALYLLRRHSARWLIFTLALLPMALFQASVMNPDFITNCLSFALFAMAVAILGKSKSFVPKHITLYLIAAAILLPLSKPPYLFLSLVCLLMLPGSILKPKTRQGALKIGGGVITTLLVFGWLYLNRKVVTALGAGALHARPTEQIRFMLHNPIAPFATFVRTLVVQEANYMIQLVGDLGFNYVLVPLWVVILSFWMILNSAIVEISPRKISERINNNQILLFLLGGLLTVVSIFMTFYLTFTPPGGSYIEGVQGRYFIPVLPFMFFGLSQIIPIRLKMSGQTATVLFAGGSTLALLTAAVYYTIATY